MVSLYCFFPLILLCSSMDSPQAAGDICSAMEHLRLLWPCPPLTLVFPLLFLTLFVPSSSLCLAFYAFFKICFYGGANSLADVLSCILWCIHWSQLDWAVFGTGQPLASSHRGHPCSPPGCHLAMYTQNTRRKVLWKDIENVWLQPKLELENFSHMGNPVHFQVFCFSLVYITGDLFLCIECESWNCKTVIPLVKN